MGKKRGLQVEDPDVIKETASRVLAQHEQTVGMGTAGVQKKMDVLEPDAFAFFGTVAEDGLAPKNFVSLEALRAVAVKQDKPLSQEQLGAYYGADVTAPQPVMECSLCGKPVVARVWAIASKGAIVADRDSAEGKPLLVGAFVKRYNPVSGEPIAMVGCGSPARPDSCLMFWREVKETKDGTDGAGNKVKVPVLFTDRYNRPKRLPSLPYAKVMEEIAKETAQRTERQTDEQSRLARLGGLVNRERTGQTPYRFDPRTPRGQRRDGGTTPHGSGR